MATIIEQAPASLPLSRPSTPPMHPHITLNTSIRGTPAAVPNKHIAPSSPGKASATTSVSPIESPKSPTTRRNHEMHSLLFPPDGFTHVDKIESQRSPTLRYIYSISAAKISEAMEHMSKEPLPDPKYVFPWLHGLHPENGTQMAFFMGGNDSRTPAAQRRRAALRRPPSCLRCITIVKAGGDLSRSKLLGAISPDEILAPDCAVVNGSARFMDIDPQSGFNVRNFQIQTGKMATVSDIIVYGDELTGAEEVMTLAKKCARAQDEWVERMAKVGYEVPKFNTFVLLDESFRVFEEKYSSLVAVDSNGARNENIVDFFIHERAEMATMTAASEIAPNVFLGPTPNSSNPSSLNGTQVGSTHFEDYDVLVEASEVFPIPTTADLEKRKAKLLLPPEKREKVPLEVPGSGTITEPRYNSVDVDGLLAVCKWIYEVSTGEDLQKDELEKESQEMAEQFPGFDMESPKSPRSEDVGKLKPSEEALATLVDADGDTVMTSLTDDEVAVHIVNEQPETSKTANRSPKKVLIHCPDGYTETSLVALTYSMYAHGITVGEAWISLHMEKKRNFFAYPTDVMLLTAIQARILASSPALNAKKKLQKQENQVDDDPLNIRAAKPDPVWLTSTYDGSLPSRVLPYLYLGNIAHAQTPAMLKELGIKRIVTVGEKIDWTQWNSMLAPSGDATAGASAGDTDDDVFIDSLVNGYDSRPSVREETHNGFEFLMIGPGVLADNGVDGLMPEFDRCLAFINRSRLDGAATLVHCRVGVSRSATICIAHVMQEMNYSFPRAYCFVRARRLNVIIQPHLRFVYEMLKWEEELGRRRGQVQPRREMEWAWVAREIAAMNRPYSNR